MKNLLKNQRGVSVIEMLYIMCLFGAVISIVGPMLRVWMYGDGGGYEGYSKSFTNSQLSRVNETKDGITLAEGCTPSTYITQEECDAVR